MKRRDFNSLIGSPINQKNLKRILYRKTDPSNTLLEEDLRLDSSFNVSDLEVIFSYFFRKGRATRIYDTSPEEAEGKLINSSTEDITYVMLKYNLLFMLEKLDIPNSSHSTPLRQYDFFPLMDEFYFASSSTRERIEGIKEFYQKEVLPRINTPLAYNLFETPFTLDQAIVINRLLKIEANKLSKEFHDSERMQRSVHF